MSIQFQALLSDNNTQLNASGAGRYTPDMEEFFASSIEVLNVEETPSYGDIASPRFVFLRLVSGDDLLVGLSTGAYPFRLTIPEGSSGESLLLRLNVEDSREISTIQTVADVAASLAGLYFDLEDRVDTVRVWLNIPAKAKQTLTLTGNAADTNTVTLGATTYTFRSPAASFVCKAYTDISQGEYFDITCGGTTKRFWYDLDFVGTGAPSTPVGGSLHSISIVLGNTDADVATATEAVIEAVTNLTSSVSTNTVTVSYDLDASIVVEDSVGDVLGTITAATALAAGDVFIGTTASITLDNLIAAITAGAGSGTLYGTGTTANASATAAAGAGDTMIATALTAGTAGNTIVSTQTLAAGTWGAATLAGGTAASTPPATPSGGRLIEVATVQGAADTVVAAAIQAALDADDEFSATVLSNLVTVTDTHTGTRTPIAAGTSTFTVDDIQSGVNSPLPHLKSIGTSQVLIAVAPN